MKLDRYPWRRNAAIIAVSAVLAAIGIGGVVNANADSGSGKSNTSQVDKAGSDGETNDDAADTGPDANLNEPGHQDASDTQSDGDGEQNDATEKAEKSDSEGETNDDAADTGPDANLNEPGHQDASDTSTGQ